jgi:catechol 2,3-dioxygenase-like lactoylglutathione lyase family enzyme
MRPEPVFAVRDVDAAMAFYARLGFAVRRHDAGYGYAERDGLRIHLRGSPEVEPFSNYAEVYVETSNPDGLHEEWRACGLLPVPGAIDASLKAEVERRWRAGEPVGLLSASVEDKPWRVREFALRDLDNNHLRFGRALTSGESSARR